MCSNNSVRSKWLRLCGESTSSEAAFELQASISPINLTITNQLSSNTKTPFEKLTSV